MTRIYKVVESKILKSKGCACKQETAATKSRVVDVFTNVEYQLTFKGVGTDNVPPRDCSQRSKDNKENVLSMSPLRQSGLYQEPEASPHS